MCLGAPKPPTPPALPPPPVGAALIDPAAQDAKNRERMIAQTRGGQASTILAGNTGAAPTAAAKTLLGG